MKTLKQFYLLLGLLAMIVTGFALLGRAVFALFAGEGLWQALLFMGASCGTAAATEHFFNRYDKEFKEDQA